MYQKHFNVRKTSQREPIPGRADMVINEAGGYVWAVDDWKRLDRFLILGAEGGTYYVKEHKLTRENAEAVLRCINADGERVVKRVVEISESGRAPKNDPALFVLAMCSGLGDTKTRSAALHSLNRVARTGTYLFTFATYIQAFRGWGRGLRDAIGSWYTEKSADNLAYQLVKYRQRGGWTHRDLLRLSHPKTDSTAHKVLFDWVCHSREASFSLEDINEQWQKFVVGYELVAITNDPKEVIRLINDYKLPWEALDTKWLRSPQVWEALLPNTPLWALMRNLGRLSDIGLLAPLSETSKYVVQRFSDVEALHRSRLHPFTILLGMRTYAAGHGVRGSLKWQPVSQVVDALDAAFYESFQNVKPTGKRFVLAVDVSGSMTSSMGDSPLTVREAAAAMAMVTARTEPNYAVVAFCDRMVPIEVSPRERLDDVVRKFSNLAFGGTDCALPMLWALGLDTYRASFWNYAPRIKVEEKRGIVPADCFIVYTDNETWAGDIHPVQALQQYRRETGIPAKLITIGMTSEGFTIADPNDIGMLDVVGFDSACPQIVQQFIEESTRKA